LEPSDSKSFTGDEKDFNFENPKLDSDLLSVTELDDGDVTSRLKILSSDTVAPELTGDTLESGDLDSSSKNALDMACCNTGLGSFSPIVVSFALKGFVGCGDNPGELVALAFPESVVGDLGGLTGGTSLARTLCKAVAPAFSD